MTRLRKILDEVLVSSDVVLGGLVGALSKYAGCTVNIQAGAVRGIAKFTNLLPERWNGAIADDSVVVGWV